MLFSFLDSSRDNKASCVKVSVVAEEMVCGERERCAAETVYGLVNGTW